MKQLLLVKMSSLGDVVHALPAVNDALARGWQVDWVVEEAFVDVVRSLPGVRTVLPIAWRRWRRSLRQHRAELIAFDQALRQTTYDQVLDSQGLIKSAVVALRARGPSVGFSHTSAREPWSAFAYRRRMQVAQGQHAISRQRQLFAAALGYELADESGFGEIPSPRTSEAPGHRSRCCFYMAPLGTVNTGRKRCGVPWSSWCLRRVMSRWSPGAMRKNKRVRKDWPKRGPPSSTGNRWQP